MPLVGWVAWYRLELRIHISDKKSRLCGGMYAPLMSGCGRLSSTPECGLGMMQTIVSTIVTLAQLDLAVVVLSEAVVTCDENANISATITSDIDITSLLKIWPVWEVSGNEDSPVLLVSLLSLSPELILGKEGEYFVLQTALRLQ